MSDLASRAEEYLALRRALGYKLRGYDAVLREFVEWLDDRDAGVVTAEFALTWAQSRPTSSPVRQRQRLTIVRRFAEYLCAIDPRTEVPSKDLLPARNHRTVPYIYSPAEIASLMAAARSLTPPLKAATYETLIGLLACTGLRFGEAAGLDRVDVSVADACLIVRHAKNDRCRLVPVHTTTITALSTYAARRDRLCPCPTTPSFLVSTRGGRLAPSSVQAVFAARSGGTRPRACPAAA